jgi:hypothetical protein
MSIGGREHQAPALTIAPSGTPRATLAKRAAVLAAVTAVLFFCYWRQSQSAPVSSDGAGNVLQAWDMLHGNVLLHNWWVSDVSFYTTELPQYVLIEALLGFGSWVVHVGAAMTYTLLVLLAALVAKGNAQGREGLGRALLAAGIMLSPQLSATSVLLLSPDHTGTAVPVLVIWLLIDRVAPGGRGGHGGKGFPPTGGLGGMKSPPRVGGSGGSSPRAKWLVPVLVGVGFLWSIVADSVVLLTSIVPLVLVCAVRSCPGLIRGGERPAPKWYELSLAGAAAVAGVAGAFAPRLMAALGGYRESRVGTGADFSQLQHGSWVTFQAALELFGANFFGAKPAIEVVFVAVHLAGVIMVIWALGVAAGRFFRFGDLIVPVFAVAIVLNLGAYLISPHARDILGAREIAGVLPLGAVLAGRILGGRILGSLLPGARVLGDPVLADPVLADPVLADPVLADPVLADPVLADPVLADPVLADPVLGGYRPGQRVRAARWTAPRWTLATLAVITAGYLGALGYGAAQDPVPAANEPLAAWLTAHGLTGGLASYWQSNSTALDSHGRLLVSAVTLGGNSRLVPYLWETDDANYNPSLHYANFVVADGFGAVPGLQTAVVLTFGQPERTYHADGYTIMVWNRNLLAKLGHM